MTEMCEGVLPPAPENERKNEKKPLKIRIVLFFDGTLNNRINIEEREKHEMGEASEAYSNFRTDDANSYDNGRTNIAIMEPHLSKEKEDYTGDYDLVYKHYIPGQGALTRQKDSLWGYALAIGESGVPRRAEEGIKKAVASIFDDKDNVNSEEHFVEKLSIDVFGFSRGAATARYAIHVIFDGRISQIDEVTGEVYYEWRPISQRLNNLGYEIDEKAVEVKFAGLYDTVLSYFGSQKIPWTANALQQTAVARAKKALHLAAADEHRKDFPLHTIKSAVNAGVGEEYYLPGVHSDVGGSYNLANEKMLEKETDEGKKTYMLSSDEGAEKPEFSWLGNAKGKTMVIHEGDTDRLKKDRQDLIDQGWFKENEITLHDMQWDDRGRATYSVLTVSRKNICSAYCNIPLKIMARYARKPDVKLSIDAKLEERANIILKSEEDLLKLEDKINLYIETNKNSTPEDWIGNKSLNKHPEIKEIRHRHFHFSASKWSAGYKPNFEWDKVARQYRRRRYYYDA